LDSQFSLAALDVTKAAFYDTEDVYLAPKGYLGVYSKRKMELDALLEAAPGSEHHQRVSHKVEELRRKWMHDEDGHIIAPRIWLSGGGFFGTHNNRHVRKVDAHLDLWWTRDGIEWFQVSSTKSGDDSSYASSREAFTQKPRSGRIRPDTVTSTCEAYQTSVQDRAMFLGKYGHTMLPFRPVGSDVPALFFIAGDTDDDGPLVADVFQSTNGALCEFYNPSKLDLSLEDWRAKPHLRYIEGVVETCSGHGACGEILPQGRVRHFQYSWEAGTAGDFVPVEEQRTVWMQGCVCDEGYVGEYCEGRDPGTGSVSSSVRRTFSGAASRWMAATSTLLLALACAF
jgi:hypothetical protein